MLKQKVVTIGDSTYMLTAIPATRGLKILKDLSKLIGPSFAEIAAGNEDALSAALSKLFDNLDAVNVEALIVDIVASGATKDSMSINFNIEFAGAYDNLFNLVREIIEFNFGTVFTLLGSAAQ